MAYEKLKKNMEHVVNAYKRELGKFVEYCLAHQILIQVIDVEGAWIMEENKVQFVSFQWRREH